MSEIIRDEWLELNQDFKNLENEIRLYQTKLEEVNKCRLECEKKIHHQKYRISQMKTAIKVSGLCQDLKEEIIKRETHLSELTRILPRKSDAYLKVILGSVNVSIAHKEEKLRYKEEYEKFKLIMSVVAFIFALINLSFISRRFERLYIFMLMWYYCTLTIRESILRVNGSRIKGWWRAHHFFSTIASAVMLIWPEGESWNNFRYTFFIFNVYLSFVQSLQFVYQKGALYRLKALGERDNMDITIEGFHRWMWRGLGFLFPFLFLVYLIQVYIAYSLYYLSLLEGATWHVRITAVMFAILSAGNITTLIMIIPDKIKNNVVLKYRVLYQRLWSKNDNKGK